jgi:hypothetical protein
VKAFAVFLFAVTLVAQSAPSADTSLAPFTDKVPDKVPQYSTPLSSAQVSMVNGVVTTLSTESQKSVSGATTTIMNFEIYSGGSTIVMCRSDENRRLRDCEITNGHTLTEAMQYMADALSESYKRTEEQLQFRREENARTLETLRSLQSGLRSVSKALNGPHAQKQARP